MEKTTSSQLDVVLLAKEAFECISSDKYNHVHLCLDGLKNHIIEERTKKIRFVNYKNNKYGDKDARLA